MNHRHKSITCIGMLVLIAIQLTACHTISSEHNNIDKDNGCIPPLFEFAYPVDAPRTGDIPAQPLPQGMIPQFTQAEKDRYAIKLVGNLIVKSDDEIWFINGYKDYHIMRYTPSTGKIEEFPIVDKSITNFNPSTLFLSSDNTLWIFGSGYNEDNEWDTFVGYLNQKEGNFEIVKQFGLVRDRAAVGEDSGGIIWIVDSDGLVRFDPGTYRATRILGWNQGYILSRESLSIDGENGIWMISKLREEVENYGDEYFYLIRYDPSSGETQNYGKIPGQDLYTADSGLLVDHRGRIWVGDYAYLQVTIDGSGAWFQIVRSPVFIFDPKDPILVTRRQYYWHRPDPRLETQYRYLWFLPGRLVRLDLKTEEWCLVADTLVVSVAEDSHHNLWIGGQDQLYKYEYRPK